MYEYIYEYFVIWYRCKYLNLLIVLQCETVFVYYIFDCCKTLCDNNLVLKKYIVMLY